MKKTITPIIAFFCLAITFASCSTDLAVEGTDPSKTNSDVMQQMTFTASQEDSEAQTRTVLSGYNVQWQSDDAVAIWDGTQKNEFTISSGAGTTSATFSGSVTANSTDYVAVYPNSIGKDCTYSSDKITNIVIPYIQTATAGTFDPDAAVMTATATSTNTNFSFKNVCSFLKIVVPSGKEYLSIVVSVTSGNIAGTFSCKNYATDPTLEATNGKNMIILQPASGSTSITAGTYYIAFAPCNMSGLKVDCYTSAAVCDEETATAELAMARSKIYSLGTTENWASTNANLLLGAYSVSATKKVMFTRGNLYWDGTESKYHLETNQTDYDEGEFNFKKQTYQYYTYNTDHVNTFFWISYNKYANGYMPYASSYHKDMETFDDEFWCGEKHALTIDGTNKLYALSGSEWAYLFKSRDNASNLYKNDITVTDGSKTYQGCLLIAPDNFDTSNWHTGDTEKTYTLDQINELGLTCLPTAGQRVNNAGDDDRDHHYDDYTDYYVYKNAAYTFGTYWSASPDSDLIDNACGIYFDTNGELKVPTDEYENRYYGACIRPVYTYSGE